jgi:hypothetical protein
MWAVIHMCMETIQGISLYSYLHLKLPKTLCFSLYRTYFFLQKIGEQEGGTGSAGGRGEGGPNNVYTCK